MKFLHDVWFTFLRRFRASLREPIWMFFSLIQPLTWLLLFTQLFENVILMPGFPTRSYLQFFVPGLIVMLAVFSSAYSGFEFLSDIYYGMLEKVLVTPVNRYALIIGTAMNWALELVIQMLIVFGIAYILGAKIATGILGIALTIVVVVLLGLGFFGFSNALVLKTKKEEPFVVTANLITLPLMFLSSIMMPSEFAPEWLRTAMKFNPLNYAVEAVRPLFLGEYNWHQYLISITVLGTLAFIGVAVATFTLSRFSE